MAHYEELAVRLPDGYAAYGRYWSAADGHGAVLYHHGIQSHCGWFEASAGALADAGYSVLQIDRRGCGRNPDGRGHADSAEQLIDDSVAAGRELMRRSGHGDYHIVGVSWGGKLAVAHYVERPEGVLSLHLVTPGLFPRVLVSSDEMATIGFAMLYEPERSFDIPLNDPELLTSDPRWQAFFADDELTLRQCTAGFYLASRRMDRIVGRLGESKPVPVHLMLAGDEHIIDNEKTRSYVADLGWNETRVTQYATARHTLEFDMPDRFVADLVAFIKTISDARTSDPPTRS